MTDILRDAYKPCDDITDDERALSKMESTVVVDPKVDGNYCILVSDGSEIRTISRAGKEHPEWAAGFPKGLARALGKVTLVGELEVGTQTGTILAVHRGYGLFHVFDIPSMSEASIITRKTAVTKLVSTVVGLRPPESGMMNGSHPGVFAMSILPYKSLRKQDVIPTFRKWESHGVEGLVAKFPVDSSWNSEWWMKKKSITTNDYVVTGVNWSDSEHVNTRNLDPSYEGELIEAIVGGTWLIGLNGEKKFVPNVVRCGTMDDSVRLSSSKLCQSDDSALDGRVMEVGGFGIFLSGSTRHPHFIRWRDDKPTDQCVVDARKIVETLLTRHAIVTEDGK